MKESKEAFVKRKLKLAKKAAVLRRRADAKFKREQKANPFAPSIFK